MWSNFLPGKRVEHQVDSSHIIWAIKQVFGFKASKHVEFKNYAIKKKDF